MLLTKLSAIFYIVVTFAIETRCDCFPHKEAMRCSDGDKIDPSTIQTLDLSNTGLKQLNQDFLLRYRHVTHLNLSSNSLKSVERLAPISVMDKLEHLDLSNNSLIFINFRIFARNRNLKVLYLNDNPHMLISPTSADLKLRELHIESCGLEELRTGTFKEFKRLKVLNLQNNKIADLPMDFHTALPFVDSVLLMGNPILDVQIEDGYKYTDAFVVRMTLYVMAGVFVVMYFMCCR